MKRQEKEAIVNVLAEKLSSNKFIYLTDTSALTAIKTNELRRSLFKEGIVMTVAKNTLIKKAMESTDHNFGDLLGTLKGTTAIMFSREAKTAAKVIKEFRKSNDKPLLKGAYIDNDIYVGDAQLDSLLALKSREELIGDIVGLLQSPAKNVISALSSGGNKLAGIVKTLSEKEN